MVGDGEFGKGVQTESVFLGAPEHKAKSIDRKI
jgi:hypothetical protein